MKKMTVLIVCMLFAVSGLYATGIQEGTEAKPTVTISVPWAGAELDQFLPVLKAFEAKENVKVKYLTYRGEDLSSILPAQFEAKQSLADIIFIWDWWVKKNPQYAIDLTSLWAPQKSAFIPSPAKAGGKVVSVPYVMVAKPGFWYRKSFFSANGLKVPGTWLEFTLLLKKIGSISGIKNPIVTGNGVGWPISDVTEHFLIAFGGADLQNDLINKKVKWTDPRVKKVFTNYLVPLLVANAFSDPVEWTQAIELWWGGDYGLYFMGNWITGMVKDASDLGVFSLPGAKALVTGQDWAFIPKYSDNVDLAKKLLSFMLSKEGQTIRAKSGGKLVIRNDVSSSLYPKADQAVAAVVAKMETTVTDLDDSIGGDWQRLFWDQLKLLWVSPTSLDDVLRKLQSELPK